MTVHSKSLALFGGSEGVLEPGLVESALASAVNESVYGGGDEFAVAAALMFLRLNGHRFFVDDGSLYDALIAVAERRMTKAGLADVLRKQSQKI